MQTLKIDIVSDVVCPWCYIGYKQLEKALLLMNATAKVVIHWHAFELNPTLPEGGEDIGEHMQRKYGVQAKAKSPQREHMLTLAKSLGIDMKFGKGRRIYNTFKAHRALFWARQQGCQTEFKLALFKAYFEEGQDPSDPDVLSKVARDLSLDEKELQGVLSTDKYINEVRAEQKTVYSMGIQSVPTFILNEKYTLPGAQDAERLAKAFDHICAEAAAS
ncbi:MAG: DsbA family oxidoreductase [Pseudomonadales bacterium]|nr:DsbA family oxidoreductase [Pseudomonadales bacterium]